MGPLSGDRFNGTDAISSVRYPARLTGTPVALRCSLSLEERKARCRWLVFDPSVFLLGLPLVRHTSERHIASRNLAKQPGEQVLKISTLGCGVG